MLRFLSIILVILVSSFHQASSETCYYGWQTYYCSLGQTCGSYYGDCRGLSAYAIMGIVFASITLLGICIRCCIYMNAPRTPRTIPVTVTTTPSGRVVRVRVRPGGTPAVRTVPVGTPVHMAVEEAPPSYAAVTTPGYQGKY